MSTRTAQATWFRQVVSILIRVAQLNFGEPLCPPAHLAKLFQIVAGLLAAMSAGGQVVHPGVSGILKIHSPTGDWQRTRMNAAREGANDL